MIDRRDFLRRAALAGGALTLRDSSSATWLSPSREAQHAERTTAPLDILILGGTGLTGPHQVRYALARGHKVTVFNRGRRNDRLPPGVTELIGDRNLHQVDALRGKK